MTVTYHLPVDGQSNPMFTLIDPRGDDLYRHLMELNRIHADDEVKKTSEKELVSELAQLRDRIRTLNGVTRREMEEVEQSTGMAIESYPLSGFTERRSGTGVTVALEAIDYRRGTLLVSMVVAGFSLLYKIIAWFTKTTQSGMSHTPVIDSENYRREMERLEREIQKAGKSPHRLTEKDNQRLNTDIQLYLNQRNIFIEKCLVGNPSYSKAFADFIPAYLSRCEKELENLSLSFRKIEAIVNRGISEVTEEDLKEAESIDRSLDDPDFGPYRWEPYQRFLALCGIPLNPDNTLAELTDKAVSRFNQESKTPSGLNAEVVKSHGFERVNRDRNHVISALSDQEIASGSKNRYYYLPQKELDAIVKGIQANFSSIPNLMNRLKVPQKTGFSDTEEKTLMLINAILVKLKERYSLINFGIMLNSFFGSRIAEFGEKSRIFAEKYLDIIR